MSRILVTGYRGFIGSLLWSELDKKGFDIIGIDHKDGEDLLYCDLPEDIDVVYHLAAYPDVAESWVKPDKYMDNIKITARIVKAYPEAKIIHASSCAASDPSSSPYGFTKWVASEYLKRFHKNYVNLIFPNIYGKGSRSVVDIFKDKEKVIIFGTGEALRDYVHVDDIVDGLVKAKEWDCGEYSMGGGTKARVIDLAEGKEVDFREARKEAFEVEVPNTTPNWFPSQDVFEYMKL